MISVVALPGLPGRCSAADRDAQPYLDAVRSFADTVTGRGRDVYGDRQTPLFADGLHARNLEPVRWMCRGETWVLCNFASQQPLLRTLDGLSAVTGEPRYRQAAEEATRYALKHLRGPNGLLLGDMGDPPGNRAINRNTDNSDWRVIYALLELYRATADRAVLRLACRVGDNILRSQAETGLFPRPGRHYARTGDERPLALLHLAAAIDGKQSLMPQPIYDSRFFHCEYHGQLDASQQKRADKRTYDHLVFYGEN
jgi:hypothetical protein